MLHCTAFPLFETQIIPVYLYGRIAETYNIIVLLLAKSYVARYGTKAKAHSERAVTPIRNCYPVTLSHLMEFLLTELWWCFLFFTVSTTMKKLRTNFFHCLWCCGKINGLEPDWNVLLEEKFLVLLQCPKEFSSVYAKVKSKNQLKGM